MKDRGPPTLGLSLWGFPMNFHDWYVIYRPSGDNSTSFLRIACGAPIEKWSYNVLTPVFD